MNRTPFQIFKAKVQAMNNNNQVQMGLRQENSPNLVTPSCETKRFHEDSAPLIFGLGDDNSVVSESVGEIDGLVFDGTKMLCSTPKEKDNFDNSSTSSSEENTPIAETSFFDASIYSNLDTNKRFAEDHLDDIYSRNDSLLMNTHDEFSPNPSHTPRSLNFSGFSNPISSGKKNGGHNLFTSKAAGAMWNIGDGDLSLLSNGGNFFGAGLNDSMLFQHQAGGAFERQPLGASMMPRSNANMLGEKLMPSTYSAAVKNMMDNDSIIQQLGNIQLAPNTTSPFPGKSLAQDAKPLESKEFLYALIISQLVADEHLEMATSLAQAMNLYSFRCLPTDHLQTIVSYYLSVMHAVTNDPSNLARLNELIFSLDSKILKFFLDSGKIKMGYPTTSSTDRPSQNAMLGIPTPSANHTFSPASMAMNNEHGPMMHAQPPPSMLATGYPKKNDHELRVMAKLGALGSGPTELHMPHGFCIGLNDDIVIADTNNHRISIFTLKGEYRYSFGEEGVEPGKLYQPRKIALLRPSASDPLAEPVFVVCDRGSKRSRMQIFALNGQFIRVIDIPYIDIVSGLTTTHDGKIVVVDSVKSAVSVLLGDGTTLNWFICGSMMNEPSDIAVHRNEFYICDFKGNSVMVFNQHGKLVRTIGSDYTRFPNGIDISDNGDVMVGNSHGNRFHVTLFNEEGRYIGDYECSTLKVSRCCGLKCTKDGFVVTLAKNNHHALVLTPIYC